MSASAAILVLAGFVWLLFAGLVWKNSPIARREFHGGPVRLFVGQLVAYSLPFFITLNSGVSRSELKATFGFSELGAFWTSLAVGLGAWALLRFGIPFTRRAANEWELWRRRSWASD